MSFVTHYIAFVGGAVVGILAIALAMCGKDD